MAVTCVNPPVPANIMLQYIYTTVRGLDNAQSEGATINTAFQFYSELYLVYICLIFTTWVTTLWESNISRVNGIYSFYKFSCNRKLKECVRDRRQQFVPSVVLNDVTLKLVL